MQKYEPLTVLPFEIVRDFRAGLFRGFATKAGLFQLVGVKITDGAGHQGQRITVQVIDENGFPVPNVSVAFAYSTGKGFEPAENAQWFPSPPWRGLVVLTNGGGQCDMVLGAEGVVKDGQAGGVMVYVLEPEYASDEIAGCGMLADHSGMLLTFQLCRTGVHPLADRLLSIEERLAVLESVASEMLGDA